MEIVVDGIAVEVIKCRVVHAGCICLIAMVMARCLPPASFRFRLAADKLAFGCNLPTIRAV